MFGRLPSCLRGITVNGIDEMLAAAREGIGIALVPEDLAEP